MTDQPARREARNELVEAHLHLVQHVVSQVATRYPRHVDRQELWNAGALGLVDASRRYDPSTGIPFGRYAIIRIRGAIIDSTRSRDWATRAVRRNIRDIREATEAFEQQEGRQPSTAELADALGITEEQIEAHRTSAAASTLLHLDQRIGHELEETTLGDLIEEQATERLPESHLADRELTGTLRVAVAHLPEVQREVVERYYFAGEYLRDIADSMGVTEARISQIRGEALTAIRAYFATAFDGVPEVDDSLPGRRSREAYLAALTANSTWRDRLDAADVPVVVEAAAVPA